MVVVVKKWKKYQGELISNMNKSLSKDYPVIKLYAEKPTYDKNKTENMERPTYDKNKTENMKKPTYDKNKTENTGINKRMSKLSYVEAARRAIASNGK